jgi:transcriptional regulator with XRE-family HTH domain
LQVGQKIKEARKQIGMSQEKFALARIVKLKK